MNRLCAVLMTSIFIVGCGTTQVWYQTGKSPADAHSDFKAAKIEAVKANDPHGLGALGLPRARWGYGDGTGELVNSTMRSKGYEPRPAKTLTNGLSYPESD